ncbi:MAG: septum formation protein Maf [Anaerolineaceae bacterium]|nr:septum formation protein Maf [Anaerolineaceae bacterium]
MAAPTLLLASGSPRRRQLLSLTGWNFSVAPAEVDETPLPGEHPRPYTLRLAEAKARAVLPPAEPGTLILAADTTVADEDTLLGKPSNAAEARRMLRRLRGHTHQVTTALAVLNPHRGEILTDVCVSQVPMRAYSDEEMETYIASGDPLDKAGAYAIQNSAFQPVTGFRGCFANVMGLPLCHIARTFKKFDCTPHQDIAPACQSALQYDCPVFAAILNGEKMG